MSEDARGDQDETRVLQVGGNEEKKEEAATVDQVNENEENENSEEGEVDEEEDEEDEEDEDEEERDLDDLPSSRLGTKEYWDQFYTRDLKNFQEFGDPGEAWFAHVCKDRIPKWIVSLERVSKTDAILDVGCGNAIFLCQMQKAGFANLTGTDYSKPAIDLSISVASEKGLKATFLVDDVLNTSLESESFDLIHDKGTFDAIALAEDSREAKIKYRTSVIYALKQKGLFVITSCNFTKQELLNHFEGAFSLVSELPHPVFRFGGQEGMAVTSLAFEKL